MPEKEYTIYIVFFESAYTEKEKIEELGLVPLNPNLYFARSTKTQSRLYHDIKYALTPETLLVGKLKEEPKFKGMLKGTTKWIRNHFPGLS